MRHQLVRHLKFRILIYCIREGSYYSDTYNKPLVEMTINEILNAQNKIFDYNQIRIPVIVWNQEIFMRVSIQAYNKPQDLEKMLEMLKYFNLF